MDDYNINVLSEAKNEYSCRLLSILTPVVIDGIKSIFNDAEKLCIENDEDEKYLMTFQNFLTRIPKWNDTIIEDECARIISVTSCNYLEDLLTCVHIAQLKILTSVRVSQKQKKIDLDIPKLSSFIHQVYSAFARKLYKNVYLFEKIITPLQYQKNMRECELLCKESILEVIRNSIPVEKILRSYIDETVDEEVIQEIVEKEIEKEVEEKQEASNKEETNKEEEEFSKTPILKLEKNSEELNLNMEENVSTENTDNPDELNDNINDVVINEPIGSSNEPTTLNNEIKDVGISFNDVDSVLDMGTNIEKDVEAPKTIERLEQISEINNQRRKEEEEDDDDEDNLEIFDDNNINLDISDIHDLSKELKISPPILLNDIEILD
tara:strand:+ start:4641 stop:5780 length:1140 start_codon:yes stop_codon:yes gene_type:complete